MNTPAKITAFAAAVAVIAGAGWAIGAAAGPLDRPEPARHAEDEGSAHAVDEGGGHGGEEGHGAVSLPGGLASSQDGYTFVPVQDTLRAGREQDFRFRILGPDGHALTRFAVEHEKKLHLIVVRRDGSGFQHVHPRLGADGLWSIPLELTEPGSYRAFADFKPVGGDGLTLGVDLAVPGSFTPKRFAPSRESTVDGYHVRLDGELRPGETSDLTLTVSRGGKPVTDLQPYLGAAGHLVALRHGDLAYLHVHPVEPDARGPEIAFGAEVPSEGTYRLYLDFKHGGKVRTAEFTVAAEGHHG